MSSAFTSTDEQAYDQVVAALQRRGMSRRKAARVLARLAQRSLVKGAHTLAGKDINYHVAFHALRVTAPEVSEMHDDTHPHVGMPVRLCALVSAAFFAGGLLFAQRILNLDLETGQFELGVFAGSFLLGGFFAVKGWIKWLRS